MATHAPNPGRAPAAAAMSPFWPTVWLVVALYAIKASYVELSPFWTWATFRDYFSWLFTKWIAAAGESDALFAIGAAAVATAAILIAGKRPGWRKAVSLGFFGFGFICVVYALISRQVFAHYHAPVTYQLLALGGEPSRLQSSLSPYLTVPFLSALAGVPVAYLILSWISWRFEGSRSRKAQILMRAAVGVIAVILILVGRQLLGSEWFKAQDRHIVDSPHWTLLSSTLSVVSGARMTIDAARVVPEDLREFEKSTGNQVSNVMAATEGSGPRNLILIVLESVGTRYLSLYGSNLNTTPRLLAEQGNALVFNRYYAPVAWTAYSLLSLVSSQRPPMQTYNELSFRTPDMQGSSLASSLRQRGYQTAFMAAGEPDWANGGFLEKSGFTQVLRAKNLPGAKQVSSWGTSDPTLFEAMRNWIGHNKGQPFFLMAWTDQTHHPFKLAPGQTEMESLPAAMKGKDLGRYVSLIHEADAQIGKLLDALREAHLADDTLVVVTGDHGEAFGQPHGNSGHGFTVYEEEVRVPLVLWNPRLFKGKGRSKNLGSHTDLAPTLLDALGFPEPGGWDGRSMLGPQHPGHTYLFAAAWGQHLLGLREDDWKYIYDARGGREELYDLASDPEEQKDVSRTHSELSHRLRQRLAAWLQAEKSRVMTAAN